MNYWHIQLHPNNSNWGKEEELLRKYEVIGLGDWENGKEQIETFKNKIKKGDIVLVKSGGEKIALVEVIGDYEFNDDTNNLVWFPHRREVKILEILTKREKGFPQPRGTLNKAVDSKTETYQVIDNWYKKVIKDLLNGK